VIEEDCLMMAQPRVGLLPLYLALYDDVAPQHRPHAEVFARRVADRLRGGGLDVQLSAVCCRRAEVERAVADLAVRGVDLLATLHLAYSPSLEAVDALAASSLPLALLDTTPAARFAEDATMDDLFRNHGIHGVQDLACMLRRRGRAHCLVVGHVDDQAFLEDAVMTARAGCMARRLGSSRVLVFGDEFPGMGDFAVEPRVLAGLGVTMDRIPVAELAARLRRVTEEELAAEAALDEQRFDCSRVSPQLLRASNQVGLAVRAMLEEREAGAFSFNFQSFSRGAGAPTVPFLEASKAMARGIGYAGEGDALTAALVGALLQGLGDVTFTEMFCPDWEGNALFMSHMGECNPALAANRPALVPKEYVFGDVENPVIASFPLRPGPATLVNIAPGPGDRLEIIASRCQVLDRWAPERFPDVPHFWIAPADADVRTFLRRYSECGGTHHLALALGDQVDTVRRMARMLGLNFERA
jgi:L-arabinose isomerase